MSETTEQAEAAKPAEGAEGEQPKEKKTFGQWLKTEAREWGGTLAIFIPIWLVFYTFVYELRSIPSESMVPALQVEDRVAVAKFAYGYNRNSIPFGINLLIGDNPKNPEDRIFGSLPKRGDVVVFQHPHSDKVMIKRLIGLPGDRIQMREGRLYLNGVELPREKVRTTAYVPFGESSVRQATEYRQTIPTGEKNSDGTEKTKSFLIHEWSDSADLDQTPIFNVPAGHVFMMGDNRDNSEDSRAPSGHRSMAAAFPEAWPYRGIYPGGDPKDDAVGFVPLDYLIGRAEIVLFTLHGCTQAPGAECPEGRLWKGL